MRIGNRLGGSIFCSIVVLASAPLIMGAATEKVLTVPLGGSLANLSGETQRVKVKGFDGPARLDVLDVRSFEAAVRDPAWLDSGC